MARERLYGSYDEALREWRGWKLPVDHLSQRNLANLRFVYLDDIAEDEFADIGRRIGELGGNAFWCRGRMSGRGLLVGTQMVLERLITTPGSCDARSMEVSRTLRNMDVPCPPLEWKGGRLDMTSPKVMGILNVTPDSFSDGGRHIRPEDALERALVMEGQGADIIDIGGESTRPGSLPIDADEEWRRIGDIVRMASDELHVPISVDTRRAAVAEKAIAAGASLINDVSGLRDPSMIDVLCRTGAGAIVMHMRGEPIDMQDDTDYDDLLGEIYSDLSRTVGRAIENGVREESIVIDPGLGFGKSVEQNLEIIRRVKELKGIGRPILIGASRKNFIGKVLGGSPEDRVLGSVIAATVSVWNGANIVRAHDVAETVSALRMAMAIRSLS